MKSIINTIFILMLTKMSFAYGVCLLESEIPSSTPSAQFNDNGDGTISDVKSGLMWTKCSLGQDVNDCSGIATEFTWQEALQAAETSNLAMYVDWRLPNVKELQSILEQRCSNPAINTNAFPMIEGLIYWSSSVEVNDSIWLVSFIDGTTSDGSRKSQRIYLRLVRDEY